MTIGLAVVVPGILLLVLLALSGIIVTYGRKSDGTLVAPKGARYSDASRLVRAATRSHQPVRPDSPVRPPAQRGPSEPMTMPTSHVCAVPPQATDPERSSKARRNLAA